MTTNIAWVDASYNYRLEIELQDYTTKLTFHRTAGIALKDLAAKRYDLIVVDPFLTSGLNHPAPGEDGGDVIHYGVDLIQRVREQEGPNKNTPIVAIYSDPGVKSVSRLKTAGANRVVDTTRVMPKEFHRLVKQYIR